MLFSELAMEVVGETGRLVEAAVEGLRSWAGSGWRFMEADWMVEAISTAGFDIMWVAWGCKGWSWIMDVDGLELGNYALA